MLLNYIKVAWRSLSRNKLTSFINIAGLSLAISCCLLIYLYINDELGYDRYPKSADRIYRVTRDFLSNDGTVNLHLGHVAPPAGPLLKNDFPEIIESVRVLQNSTVLSKVDNLQPETFDEPNLFIAEPAVLDMFSVDVLRGNPETALTRPFTIMLSDRMAEKYFGNEDPVGKRLRGNNAYDLEVTGVFSSFPSQSHWHPDFLMSFSTLDDDNIYGRENLARKWSNNSFSTYILVEEGFDPERMERFFPDFLDRHMVSTNPNAAKPSTWTRLYLQPLTSIHLHSHLDSEIEANGNINYIYTMSAIGFFIILIACFNFINLSTARATKRAKEVGLRKVVGAYRSQLIMQYLGESLLTVLMALVAALVLVGASLGWLNEFTGKSITINVLLQPQPVLFLSCFVLVTGLIAGLYPALVLSGFRPALILKGTEGTGRGRGTLRRGLVVIQFAITIVLVIATGVILQQIRFMEQEDLGYNKDQVVTLRYYEEAFDNFDAFYNELTRNSTINNVARSSRIPTGRLLDTQGSYVQKGDSIEATSVVLKNVAIDQYFFDTYDIPIVSGRGYSPTPGSDDSVGFVINESAAAMIGWTNEEAIDKFFQYGGVRGKIIGVVKDFHFESLHEPVIPVVFRLLPAYSWISVSIETKSMQQGLTHVENVWRQFLSDYPFEYTFLSEAYRELYVREQKESELFLIFTGLAIFIASLGLFGLATFNTLQRVKEIGIRKALGASATHIVSLLSREIVILIGVANLIAWPVAWVALREWLMGFAYRIDLNPLVFVFAGLLAMVLALLTVGSQTIKAAQMNPSSTLRE